MNKICPRCGRPYAYGSKCKCRAKTNYNKVNRSNDRYEQFYHSTQWIKLRDLVRARCYHIDFYAWFKYGEIIEGDVVHHIEEVRDSWDRRLDVDNLIYVSHKSHKEIHDNYITNREAMQEFLFDIVERIKSM